MTLDLDRDALDRWITSGRYSSMPAWITCPGCGHEWGGAAVSEYGTAWFEPHEECPKCGHALDDDDWQPDEPPELEREDY